MAGEEGKASHKGWPNVRADAYLVREREREKESERSDETRRWRERERNRGRNYTEERNRGDSLYARGTCVRARARYDVCASDLVFYIE